MQLRQQSEKFQDIFNNVPKSTKQRNQKKHVVTASGINGSTAGGISRVTGSSSHSSATNKATTKTVSNQTNGRNSAIGSGSGVGAGHRRRQHLPTADANAAITKATKDAKTLSASSSSYTSGSSFSLGATIVSRYAPQTYDAVWAIALSLRGAEERWRKDAMQQSKLDRFDYTRSDMAGEFLQQMGKLDFLGVSVSSIEIRNLQLHTLKK